MKSNCTARGLMWGLLLVLVLALTGCGGGGADPTMSVAQSDPTGSPDCGAGAASVNCGPGQTTASSRTCAMQGFQGTYPECQCPYAYQTYEGATATVPGTCVGNAPPTCPVGQSLTGYGSQCCPTGATGDGAKCYAPPPAVCPSNTYGTPPSCQPVPSCSAVVGAYFGGNACECPAGNTGTYPTCIAPCPAGDTGTYPNCIAPPSCDAFPDAYPDGNGCACPTKYVGTYPTCVARSAVTLSVTANMSPSTVTDDSLGVGAGTEATLSWSVSSNVPGDSITCTVNGGSLAVSPISVGPFPATQDNSTVASTVACQDTYRVTASAVATVSIVPPAAPPQDQFACAANGDGTYSCSWYAYEPGAECSVTEYSNSGPEASGVALAPGGTASGAAGSVGVLNDTYAPYTFTLGCSAGTTASPNPISVTPGDPPPADPPSTASAQSSPCAAGTDCFTAVVASTGVTFYWSAADPTLTCGVIINDNTTGVWLAGIPYPDPNLANAGSIQVADPNTDMLMGELMCGTDGDTTKYQNVPHNPLAIVNGTVETVAVW